MVMAKNIKPDPGSMWSKLFQTPYPLTVMIFTIVALVGVLLYDWGEFRLGFVLLLYFIVVIGFRLDELHAQLESANRRLERMTALLQQASRRAEDELAEPSDNPDVYRN